MYSYHAIPFVILAARIGYTLWRRYGRGRNLARANPSDLHATGEIPPRPPLGDYREERP